ncbi:hypothetical protein [Labedaea rhizosphaerae]|uniref:hypothetical protein n=1 Tax=Labedaea rhizosphaerae TaxID=598644 RepID=UPI00105DE2B5|nr:hypothetical protein [Labedaea rhizosphaerae]
MHPTPPPVSFAAGLYWRRSKINGAKCVPAILALDGGRLRLSSADEVAFEAPCDEVEAHFTFLATMRLTVNGQAFDLVGKGANLSPKFTAEQLAELESLRAHAANQDTLGPNLAATASPTSLLDAAFDAQAMAANIKPWRTVLPAAGVRVS